MTNPTVLAAQAVAREVADTLGAPELPVGYVVCAPSSIPETAAAYNELDRLDPTVLHAWDAMAREVDSQWRALERHGLALTVSDTNPYDRAVDLFAAVADRKLAVLSTKATGGHPYWSDEQNDRFRAVHDLLGHCLTGRGFNSHGEEAAYRAHSLVFSSEARLALATESRGQNHAGLALGKGCFAEERIAILPARFRSVEHTIPRSQREYVDAYRAARSFDSRTGIA